MWQRLPLSIITFRTQDIHIGEKPYKYETCDKIFKMSQILSAHLLIHSVKKLHQFEECEKALYVIPNSAQIHSYWNKPSKSEECGKL